MFQVQQLKFQNFMLRTNFLHVATKEPILATLGGHLKSLRTLASLAIFPQHQQYATSILTLTEYFLG
jgi:hypothetical protein